MKTIKVGVIGFGTIGSGVVRILNDSSSAISERLAARVEVARIADLDITTDRGVPVRPELLTTDADSILSDPEIDIVVELIGGYEPARSFILKAMANGKHVVTANKALLALHGDEVFAAAEEHGVNLGYEASVGGAIPIIRSIREAFVANRICAIEGIVNGTANYILSKMTDEGLDFDRVLKDAQQKGYAEADPTFDIEGVDSAHKIALLARLAYGTPIRFEDIYIQGISRIMPEDIQCAREFGYRIKLLAISKFDGKALDIRVHPAMVPAEKPIANVNGVVNAILVRDDLMVESILIGQGAGSLPTGSAVVGDIVEIARGILAGTGHRVPAQSYLSEKMRPLPLKKIDEIEGAYFLRFSVRDRPGVLSRISGILGRYDISIESMIQRHRTDSGEGVPLVMMTHEALEKNIRHALEEIDRLEDVCEQSVLIRVET